MFKDREEAGDLLALKLSKIIKGEGFVVVALLRGGIVLGKRISDYFKIPLFPLAVKKIGAPLHSELAIGAVTFDKTYYFDKEIIEHLNVEKKYIQKSLEDKWQEAQTLQKKIKDTLSLEDKRIVVVDDGIATGTTAVCASTYIKRERAKEIILAAPVISKDVLKNIKVYFDRIVSLQIVNNLSSVSEFYKNFPQVEDKEIIEILNRK